MSCLWGRPKKRPASSAPRALGCTGQDLPLDYPLDGAAESLLLLHPRWTSARSSSSSAPTFLYPAKLCLNGHEWLKRQLTQREIPFEPLDNGIRSSDAPTRVQRLAEALDAAKIDAVFRKWLRRIPHPFALGAAFVKWQGIRLLEEQLTRLREREAQFRVVTTTYIGATDPHALRRLFEQFGAEIKVQYDIRRTRLHAKAWLFRRNTGFDTAYVGSSTCRRRRCSKGWSGTCDFRGSRRRRSSRSSEPPSTATGPMRPSSRTSPTAMRTTQGCSRGGLGSAKHRPRHRVALRP